MSGPQLAPAWGWELIEQTARAFAVTPSALRGQGKSGGHLAKARFAAAWVLRNRPMAHRLNKADQPVLRSYAEIGRFMGGRDHSTIMHACRRAVEIAEREPDYRETLRALATGEAAPSIMPPPVKEPRQTQRRAEAAHIAWVLEKRDVAERNALADSDDGLARMAGTIALGKALQLARAA